MCVCVCVCVCVGVRVAKSGDAQFVLGAAQQTVHGTKMDTAVLGSLLRYKHLHDDAQYSPLGLSCSISA